MQIICKKGHFLIEPVLGVQGDPLRVFVSQRTIRPQRNGLPREAGPLGLLRRWPTR